MRTLYPNFKNGWTVWRPTYLEATVHKAYQYKESGERFPFVHYTNDGRPFVYHTGDCEGKDVVYMEFLNDGDMILTSDGHYEVGYQTMSVESFMIYFTNEQPKNVKPTPVECVEYVSSSVPFITISSGNIDSSGGCYYPETEKKPSWLKRLWKFITSRFKKNKCVHVWEYLEIPTGDDSVRNLTRKCLNCKEVQMWGPYCGYTKISE